MPDESTPKTHARRDVLKKAAVAGGIVWAAPVISSFEPAAAAVGSIRCPARFCFNDGTTNGWTIENTWGGAPSLGLWKHNTGRNREGVAPLTPKGALHYGRGVGGNYDTAGTRNAGRVYSPVIRMPSSGAMTVSFDMLRYVENYNGNYDVLRVSVYYAGTGAGPATAILFSVNSQTPSPQPPYPAPGAETWQGGGGTVPAAFAGLDVRFQIDFDTVDGVANGFEGVWIDNFTVPCAYPPTVAGLKPKAMSFGVASDGPPPETAPQPGRTGA